MHEILRDMGLSISQFLELIVGWSTLFLIENTLMNLLKDSKKVLIKLLGYIGQSIFSALLIIIPAFDTRGIRILVNRIGVKIATGVFVALALIVYAVSEYLVKKYQVKHHLPLHNYPFY